MDWMTEIYANFYRASQERLDYTRKAFAALPPMARPLILDAGCGEGDPTLELARLSNGKIIALDCNRAALETLARRSKELGVENRIQPVAGSMACMGFGEQQFDLVWTEGAIRLVGFVNALDEFHRVLKAGGSLVMHEATCPRGELPEELRPSWRDKYTGVKSLEEILEMIRASRFTTLSHEALPVDVWWIDYFQPLENRLRALREKYADNPAALAAFESEAVEIDLFKKYPAWYGSAFFILRKCE